MLKSTQNTLSYHLPLTFSLKKVCILFLFYKLVLLAYSVHILGRPIRFSVQYLQFLNCMEHNETCKASDWVEHVIWCVLILFYR